MPIESRCNGCGKSLRVADEHAGKQARCPECGYVYSVPLPTSAAPTAQLPTTTYVPANPLPWYMKTPEGQIYGPVSREQLGQWTSEGRVSNDCFVREGDHGAWQTADQAFPTLQAPRTRATAASTGGGYAARPQGTYVNPSTVHRPYTTGNPYAATHAHAAVGYQQPHRGGLILTFGLLGWFVCPIFAVVAWSMGSDDLNKMRLGQMDPSGQGITQAGQILGMIQSILLLAGLGLMFLFCLLTALSGG